MAAEHVDHIALPVHDLEGATDWFRSRFEYVEYARGGSTDSTFVRVGPTGGRPVPSMVELVASEARHSVTPGSRPELVVRVSNESHAVEALTAAGVTVDTVEEGQGQTGHRIHGPGDNHIGLVERDVGLGWVPDHVILYRPDPDAAADWYAGVLGFETDGSSESPTLGLPAAHPTAVGVTIRSGDRHPGTVDPWSDGHLAVACPSISSFVEEAVERGLSRQAVSIVCGGTRAVIRDPAGYPIVAVERPPEP